MSARPDHRGRVGGVGFAIGALGVVYGDIGTSPLYAFRVALGEQRSLAIDDASVLGVLSLIFWSLIAIVTVKYVLLVMRADNDGVGGILGLTSLFGPPPMARPVVETGPAPMGPFSLGDLIGLDTFEHIRADLAEAYDDRYADGGLTASLVSAGRLGRKSDRGYFSGTSPAAEADAAAQAVARAYYEAAADEARRCLEAMRVHGRERLFGVFIPSALLRVPANTSQNDQRS